MECNIIASGCASEHIEANLTHIEKKRKDDDFMYTFGKMILGNDLMTDLSYVWSKAERKEKTNMIIKTIAGLSIYCLAVAIFVLH